ncbi:MAG: hypothetical protein VKJ25_00915 [Okeania sp.]|nr:hypothetical protein [Okeania sp.]
MEEFKKSRLYKGMQRMAKEEGRQEGIKEAKLLAVPMFLELGLTVEEIAQRLDLTVEQVQKAAQNNE